MVADRVFKFVHSVFSSSLDLKSRKTDQPTKHEPQQPKKKKTHNNKTCRQRIEKKSFFLSFVRKIYNQNRKSNSDYSSYAGVSTTYFLLRFYLFANLTISHMRRCVCAAFVKILLLWRAPIRNSIWWQRSMKRVLKSQRICYFWHINPSFVVRHNRTTAILSTHIMYYEKITILTI